MLVQALQRVDSGVTGGDTQGDPGLRDRDQGVGRGRNRRGVQPDHADGGLQPGTGRDRAAADQLNAVEHRGIGPNAFGGLLDCGVLATHQALDGDIAVLVVQGRQQPAQGGQGVRHHATELTGVDRVAQGADLDNAIDDSTQAGGEGRLADTPVSAVGNDVEICREIIGVVGEDASEGG